MKLSAHQYLLEIENYTPGKAKIGDKKAIKLSSNENALGASSKAIEAYKSHATEISRYADGSCSLLRQSLAQKNNLDPEKIVCGAGSDELIALITAAFAGIGDEVIYSEHGFLMYPISAKRVGAKATKVKETNLKTDIKAILKAINSKTKIIFLANPNNPTGSYLNQHELQELLNNVPKNILIVLDCAYQEFVFAKDYPNAIDLVNRHENLVMTRTFSKIYGLASLRIGWCYSSFYIAEILNKIRGPFNVGGPAQAAAIAALEDEKFFNLSKNHNQKWLEIFFSELANNLKIKLYPSVANFILIDFGKEDSCQNANKKFLEQGFILRGMSGYGLPNCLRLSIGKDSENIQVLEILKNYEF